MSLFNTPTKYDIKDAESTLSHMRSLVRNLSYCDSVSQYYSKIEEIGITFDKFYAYEKRGVKFTSNSKKVRQEVIQELESVERSFIDRAYQRCERDSLKYKTKRGVLNCYERFFAEFMYYVDRIYPSNYKYLLSLEDHVSEYFNSQP